MSLNFMYRDGVTSELPGAQRTTGIQYTLELLFSLNLAFVIVFVAFIAWEGLSGRFYWLEGYIRIRLHMQFSDYNSGHIAIWLPSVVLGLCFWAMLRVTWRTRVARETLRIVPGLVALFS